jgi:hypothetical protein
MDSRIIGVLAAGDGLATTARLRVAGVSDERIAGLCRAGELVVVRRGVYTSAALWASWDPYVARPLARIRAADLTLRSAHVFSHDSAAILHGVPLLRPDGADVHVSRLDLRGRRSRHGIHHHGARYRPDQVEVVRGLATLDPARTVVDVAREHGYRAGLVAADGALQLGVTRRELWAAAEAMAGWPYSLTVNAAVADSDGGAESPGETLARELILECGLGGAVETQFPVQTVSGTVWADLRIGRHLVEFDGREKFRSRLDGGLREVDLEQLIWDERRRQHEMCAEGFGMTRFVYADYWGDRRERAIERLTRENAVTVARFGTALTPQQAELAARLRGRRAKAG